MKTELEKAFHAQLAEPQKPSDIILSIMKEGFSEAAVRSTMWQMLASKELTLSLDWEIQNGENYPKQLRLPNFETPSVPVFEASNPESTE